MKPGIRRLIEDLRGARVLVVHPRDAEGDALIDQLKRIGCNVRGMWPPPAEMPRDIDTVFHYGLRCRRRSNVCGDRRL